MRERMPKLPTKIYCDGGVIGSNPSKVGGTWAFCWVDENDCLVNHGANVITPEGMSTRTVTNNQTELLAAVMALSSVPEGWSGTLFTDSLVTLHRITDGVGFDNIPGWLDARTRLLRNGRRYKAGLVGGHPTKAELLTGRKRRNGLPVSHWNAFCHDLCQKEAEKFLRVPRA